VTSFGAALKLVKANKPGVSCVIVEDIRKTVLEAGLQSTRILPGSRQLSAKSFCST
jgi:hypothetical protein